MKLLGKIPTTHFHVACSGGSDSMAVVDFLRKFPRNKFDILHFHHGTESCSEAFDFVSSYCKDNGIELHAGRISRDRGLNESQEEYWRNERYAFLKRFSGEPIVMAHHLTDCIETWVMTSLVGNPQVIPYFNPKYNIIRPFLLAPKSEINDWLTRHDVEYVYDKSNSDTSIKRNYVRHELMNHIYHLNPGIEKTMKKLVMKNFKECSEMI